MGFFDIFKGFKWEKDKKVTKKNIKKDVEASNKARATSSEARQNNRVVEKKPEIDYQALYKKLIPKFRNVIMGLKTYTSPSFFMGPWKSTDMKVHSPVDNFNPAEKGYIYANFNIKLTYPNGTEIFPTECPIYRNCSNSPVWKHFPVIPKNVVGLSPLLDEVRSCLSKDVPVAVVSGFYFRLEKNDGRGYLESISVLWQ